MIAFITVEEANGALSRINVNAIVLYRGIGQGKTHMAIQADKPTSVFITILEDVAEIDRKIKDAIQHYASLANVGSF